LLRQFKEGYNATFNAMVYTTMIGVLTLFLLEIPIIGAIVEVIVIIWGLVSAIVWLARFQKISGVMSLAVIMTSWIVIFIIIFVLTLAVILR
ncbi:MAG: hypothetical protein ACP5M9_04465, partial [Candidatus Micrarchaeia archaeon]